MKGEKEMAYRCIENFSRECDGCMRCTEKEAKDKDYMYDDYGPYMEDPRHGDQDEGQ